MPTRNVVLSQHQHDLVEDMVSSGKYQNASEVLRAGLRLLEQQEAEHAARISALRSAIDVAWADDSLARAFEVDAEDVDEVISELGRRAAPNSPSR